MESALGSLSPTYSHRAMSVGPIPQRGCLNALTALEGGNR
jgi:hypothetical protein